jgi:putative transposase
MLMGIKRRIYPTTEQKIILSQWMGADRCVWNAKCDQWNYEKTFAAKYMPVGTYAPIDASYSQFKDKELTPYLFHVPPEVIKDAANRWRNTMRNWMNPKHPQAAPAQRRKKRGEESVYLEQKLFQLKNDPITGRQNLSLGTEKYPVGFVQLEHRGFLQLPKSLRVKKKAGIWWVSFCYEDALDESSLLTKEERLAEFRSLSKEELFPRVIGIDRGIKVACQTDEETFDYTQQEKSSLKSKDRRVRNHQKHLARQKKGSLRAKKRKHKISRLFMKMAHIRNNFCHQVSNKLTKNKVNEPVSKVIVMEDLKIKNMTKRAKPKKNEETGVWEKNGASRKSGLSKAILSIGWYKLEQFTGYKSYRRGHLFIKVSAHYSSQECADCDHIHPSNRKTQAEFHCQSCGKKENADKNAGRVLKKRAIKLIQHSGSELSGEGVLSLPDIGRGALSKSKRTKVLKDTGLRNVNLLISENYLDACSFRGE